MRKKLKLIVAAGENCADMRYAGGFAAPDDFVYANDGTRALMVLSALEHDRGCAQGRRDVEVWSNADLGLTAGASFAEVAAALARRFACEAFEVPGDFPLQLADRLRAMGFEVTAAAGAFWPEREFKNAFEVGEIRSALGKTEDAVRHAFEVIGASSVASDGTLVYRGETLTSELLRFEIDSFLMKLGAEASGSIVAGGPEGAVPHNAGSGPLRAHEPIVMDIFPRLKTSGYYGDLTRTVVKGRASEIVRRAFAAVKAARERGKELIRPGADPAAVYQAAADILERAGFHTGERDGHCFGFFHSLGHGVGLDIHETPRLGPRNHSALRGGEIITVEPGLYYPEWGGIRLEDMVLVTPGGCECLNRLETELEIE